MNNGQDDASMNQALTPFTIPNAISPEAYERNRQQIARMQAFVAGLEQQNQEAYVRWKLEEEIRKGAEAQRLLEEMNTRRSNVPLINPANTSPSLNNAAYGASASSFVDQGSYGASASSSGAHSAQQWAPSQTGPYPHYSPDNQQAWQTPQYSQYPPQESYPPLRSNDYSSSQFAPHAPASGPSRSNGHFMSYQARQDQPPPPAWPPSQAPAPSSSHLHRDALHQSRQPHPPRPMPSSRRTPPAPAVPVSTTTSLAGALGSQSHVGPASRSQPSTQTPRQGDTVTSKKAIERIAVEVFELMKKIPPNDDGRMRDTVTKLVIFNLKDKHPQLNDLARGTKLFSLDPESKAAADAIALGVSTKLQHVDPHNITLILSRVTEMLRIISAKAAATLVSTQNVSTNVSSINGQGSPSTPPLPTIHAPERSVPQMAASTGSSGTHQSAFTANSSAPDSGRAGDQELSASTFTVDLAPASAPPPFSPDSVKEQPAQIQQETPATPDWRHSSLHPMFKLNSQNVSSGRTVFNTPSTPQASGSPDPRNVVMTSPRTPKDVDKSTLARSILRSLGRASQSTDSGSQRESPLRVPPTPQRVEKAPVAAPTLSLPPAAPAEVIVISDDSATVSRSASMHEAPLRVADNDVSTEDLGSRLHILKSAGTAKASVSQTAWVHPEPSFPDEGALEEIRTPGAIQMALEEARESSSASPPPASRLSTPIDNGMMAVDEVQPDASAQRPSSSGEVVDLPKHYQSEPDVDAEGPESIPSLDENLSTPERAPGPSREPLFLSSPASSAKEIDNLDGASGSDDDGDDFKPSGLLESSTTRSLSKTNKGKGRARDSDLDEIEFMSAWRPSSQRARKRQKVTHVINDSDVEVIESSEPEESKQELSSLSRRFKMQVEVVVPPLSQELLRIKRRSESTSVPASPVPAGASSIRRKRRALTITSETDEVEDLVGRGSDDKPEPIVDDDGQVQLSSEERKAVEESTRCLHESPCRWEGCDAVLESGHRLGMHAPLHASEFAQSPYICRWNDCGRRFAKMDRLREHLKGHSENTLVCAFMGCSEVFYTARELHAHHNDPKHSKDLRKPQADFYYWASLPPLPPMPASLPAYMSVSRKIAKARMSREMHIWLGSKIAANITCYVHPGGRPNAAMPSRASRRLAERIAAVEKEAEENGDDPAKAALHINYDEYDSWIGYANQRGPRYCDDLWSTAVTRMVEEGLTIGSAYLAGDRRWEPPAPLDQHKNRDDNASGNGNAEMEAESDRTVVHEPEVQAGGAESAAAPGHTAPTKLDQLEVPGPVDGMDIEVPMEVTAAVEPVMSGGDEALAGATQTREQSPLGDVSVTHGDEQVLDGGSDGGLTDSETVSQPGWVVLQD